MSKPTKQKPQASADPRDDVQTLRERIVELKAERAALLQAPSVRRVALARIDQYLAYLAGEVRFNVAPFVSREASGPRELIAPGQVLVTDRVGSVQFENVERFLAWCNADALRAKMVADVDAHYATHGEGLDDETLAKRLATIDAELLDLETAEERAIMRLEAAGVRSVLRRADADPRALVAAS